ncbi:hypothetical protein HZI73_14155 [Vallitalea pronyensis]|uniref:Membrane fusion protein n=1 Tax=Vallitalea pronyensis TaxID=1348613 RepID=A0A8J8MKU4_9FIRM|nr:HlyD family efflux transporter periplasmic adaptor subunit [Vallitalea pronyensis]QUI23361.1 hypothetical protein HZI73_14155 [Vallitalea pronyensis]
MEENRSHRKRQSHRKPIERNRQGEPPRRKKRRRNQKAKGLGIGTFMYLLLFVYLIYNIVTYAMKGSIHYVSAEKGNIFEDEFFDGIILRNETVVKSASSGSTSFFVPEGEKTNINNVVCSIDLNGEFTKEVQKNLTYVNDKLAYNNNLNGHDTIKKTLYTHTMNYAPQDFDNVYALKNGIQDTLTYIARAKYIYQDVDSKTLRHKELLESQIANHVNLVKAEKSGVISYRIDGYESFDPLDLDYELLYKVDTEPMYTYKQATIKQDKPLFKIIDNDKWYIVSKINRDLLDHIEAKKNQETLEIHILEKNMTTIGKIVSTIEKDKHTYMVLEMDRYFNEYLDARTLKFQVIYKQYDGIKIPKTAQVEKEFLKIPKECIMRKGNSRGVLKKVFDEKFVGGESAEFVKLDFYYQDIENNYYVPISDNGFQMNDILSQEDGTNYSLKIKESLPGVYTINKGYVSFKLIEEEYATDQYLIVKANTSYGIRVYDRVIVDSEDIEEGMIL